MVVLSVLCLQACGFKPRSLQQLPEGIEQTWLTSATRHSPMLRSLNKRMEMHQIPIIKTVDAEQADSTVGIRLLSDSLDRRLLSLFTTGQVAEYELVYRVQYEVKFPGEEVIENEVAVTQEYQDDPDQVLARSRELELVLAEMREDAAERIIRLLASQSVVPE